MLKDHMIVYIYTCLYNYIDYKESKSQVDDQQSNANYLDKKLYLMRIGWENKAMWIWQNNADMF
jgi:hypothetical protein